MPLDLGGKMWDTDASYYSTIQVGDVTGDGRDAVIARGPYGIRTWFYCTAGKTSAPCGNLDGNSGWTSWQPQDTSSYPQFTGAQAAAYSALNKLAISSGWIPGADSTVRDVWTADSPPSDLNLQQLASNIENAAGCQGSPPSGSPPPFIECTRLPAGSSGFAVTDWTAVVNEVLSSLWHVLVQGGAGTMPVGRQGGTRSLLQRAAWRISEPRQGKRRVLHLSVPVPDAAGIRVCAAARATADSARSASAQACAKVVAARSLPAPAVTG